MAQLVEMSMVMMEQVVMMMMLGTEDDRAREAIERAIGRETADAQRENARLLVLIVGGAILAVIHHVGRYGEVILCAILHAWHLGEVILHAVIHHAGSP